LLLCHQNILTVTKQCHFLERAELSENELERECERGFFEKRERERGLFQMSVSEIKKCSLVMLA
jgi:hypothetical protein